MAIVTNLGYAGTGSIVPGGGAPVPAGTPVPGYNPNDPYANPPAPPTPTGQPATNPADVKNPDGSAYFPRYTAPSAAPAAETYTPAKSVEEVQADMTRNAQGEIDGLNRYYDSLLAEQRTVNEGRDRSTSSVSTLTGLAGSTEANVQQGKTTDLNNKDNQKIQAERGMAINGVLSKIRTGAVEEARAQRAEARQTADDILKNRTARQTEATTNLTNLAKSGVTSDGLKQTDPQAYQHLIDSLGGEEQVKALFTLNRPTESILDSSVINGKYTIAYQNPLTGAIRMESIDLGIPPGYSKSFDLGDHLAFAPDNWDGDPEKLLTIAKGLSPDQAADNALQRDKAAQDAKDKAATYGEYTEKQAKAITSINEKVSKNATYAKTTSMRTFAENVNQSLSLGNGVGDIAAINQFQKVIDEGAVTRDQDVKLISGAQSLLNTLKTKIKKLEAGDQLSTDQRTQMKTLVDNLYAAQIKALNKDPYIKAKQSEASVYGITLDDTILGELGSFESSSSGGNVVTAPDGVEVEIID